METERNWKRYFDGIGEGLGTTYERFVLHRYFEKLKNQYAIANVLECPSFGTTGLSGINSMWWATKNIPVSVVDCDEERIEFIRRIWEETGFPVNLICHKYGNALPFRNSSYDLSWNFCAFETIQNTEMILVEMARITRKVVFICTLNKANVCYWVREKTHSEESVQTKSQEREKIVSTMEMQKWTLAEKGYFDAPPWPDIAMKKEDLLEKIGLDWLVKIIKKNGEKEINILEYYAGKDKVMEENMLRYSIFEDIPSWVKKYWAHHEYFVFTPAGR